MGLYYDRLLCPLGLLVVVVYLVYRFKKGGRGKGTLDSNREHCF